MLTSSFLLTTMPFSVGKAVLHSSFGRAYENITVFLWPYLIHVIAADQQIVSKTSVTIVNAYSLIQRDSTSHGCGLSPSLS